MVMEEQGTRFARYTVVPRSLIFIFKGDSVLLLKGASDKKIWAGKYNGVGGHLERGEDILQCAKRELLEETGLAQISLHLCASVMIDTGGQPGVTLFVFKGEVDQVDIRPSDEGSLEWVRITDIDSLPLVADLYQLLPRVAEWQVGQATNIYVPRSVCN
jgi:8-oxo-dGTP diphosphatase